MQAYWKCMLNQHEKQIRKDVKNKMLLAHNFLISTSFCGTREKKDKRVNHAAILGVCCAGVPTCCLFWLGNALWKKRNKRPSLSRNESTEDLKTVWKRERVKIYPGWMSQTSSTKCINNTGQKAAIVSWTHIKAMFPTTLFAATVKATQRCDLQWFYNTHI